MSAIASSLDEIFCFVELEVRFSLIKNKRFLLHLQRLVRKKNEWKEQVYYRSSQSRSFGVQSVEVGDSTERGDVKSGGIGMD